MVSLSKPPLYYIVSKFFCLVAEQIEPSNSATLFDSFWCQTKFPSDFRTSTSVGKLTNKSMGALLSLRKNSTAAVVTARRKEEVFNRMGGDPMVIEAVEKFYAKANADERISEFFKDTNMIEQHRRQLSFLSFAFGKPGMQYAGMNMDRAHRKLVRDMGLTDVHFDAVTDHIETTLQELSVDEAAVVEVMFGLRGLRDQVLGRGKWAEEFS